MSKHFAEWKRGSFVAPFSRQSREDRPADCFGGEYPATESL